MMALEISRQKQRLDDLFSKARQLEDLEIQSHWSRYLCVLVSGFLESSIRITLSDFSRKRANPLVANYVENRLRQFVNPKMSAILDLVGYFSPEWKGALDSATSGELSDSVNSIVGNRHKIAHGDSVTLSLHSMTQYYQDAVEVISLIEYYFGI